MSKKFVLVLNCGSSSLKFSVVNILSEKFYIYGIADRLFTNKARIKWIIKNKYNYCKNFLKPVSYSKIFKFLFNIILNHNKNIFRNIIGIGHRVVHGGYKLYKSFIIDKKKFFLIKEASIFAPLHNPINILGIKASRKFFPSLYFKNVAVLDTSYHITIPKVNSLYAIPYIFYKKHKIKRYGAHGISHNFVAVESAKVLKKSFNKLNIISCHLGNGASITAIKNGFSIDTSMGLTPLEGLVMGTRSGDIDPSIIFFLHFKLGFKIKKIEEILIKKSGFLGISKKYSDFRLLEKHYFTDKYSRLSIKIFTHRLAKYISSYTSLMDDRLDALVFTGGIGENSSLIRKLVVNKLSLIGFFIENSLNIKKSFKNNNFINASHSKPILVIPTNEELFIARETIKLIKNI